MIKDRLLVYHIQGTINFNPTRIQERKLINDSIIENVDIVKSEDINFENLDVCFEIIDKSYIVVVTDNDLFITEHIILQVNYAIEKNIPVYAIRYNHKLKFKRVKLAMLLPKRDIGGLILMQSGAKSKLF